MLPFLRTPILLGCLAAASLVAAQEEHARKRIEAPPKRRPARNLPGLGMTRYFRDDMRLWLSSNSPSKAARQTLRAKLEASLQDIERASPLDERQRRKLTLAGEGEINRLFGKLDAQRHRYRQNRNPTSEFWQEAEAVRIAIDQAHFHEGSLFAKVVRRTLMDDQLRAYQDLLEAQQRQRRITWRDGLLRMLAQCGPLNAERKEGLATLFDELPTVEEHPESFFDFMIATASVSDDDYREFLDEEQLVYLHRLCQDATRLQDRLAQLTALAADAPEC
jgi:hypothetical protein